MANKRQETEIKPGDWVECRLDYDREFHVGGLYQVTKVYREREKTRLSFAKDDRGSTTNGWCAEYFVLSISQMKCEEYEAILADQDAFEKILMEG